MRFRFTCGSSPLIQIGQRFDSIRFGSRAAGVGVVLAWNDIKPSPLPAVSAAMIREAVRRWFTWDSAIERAASAIYRYDGAQPDAVREMTDLALADTWPAFIENSEEFVQYCRQHGHTASTVSLGGLLGLLVDALQHSWLPSSEILDDAEISARRWARLVMFASAESEVVLPRVENAAANDVPAYRTQRTLLPSARLGELDNPLAFLIRSYEIYCEFLPISCPASAAAFERKFGCSIGDWIARIVDLVGAVRIFAGQTPLRRPIVDLSLDGPDAEPLRGLLRRISLSGAEFQHHLDSANAPDVLAVLRRFPVLRQSDDCYLLLHPGFLLAGADDGVWYGILDALVDKRQKGVFLSDFGAAVEMYAERMLRRCAACVPHSVVTKIPESNRLRCDFAWKVGDDLILLDSKRAGLNAKMLTGDEAIVQRLDDDLGHGCSQILSVVDEARRGEWRDVAPGLDVEVGWRPRRIIGILVTHRPTYMWFRSTTELLERAGIVENWRASIGAATPMILSLSELELLEAALPQISMADFVSRIAAHDVPALSGMHLYLNAIGYHGPSLSPYYPKRAREIRGGLRSI